MFRRIFIWTEANCIENVFSVIFSKCIEIWFCNCSNKLTIEKLMWMTFLNFSSAEQVKKSNCKALIYWDSGGIKVVKKFAIVMSAWARCTTLDGAIFIPFHVWWWTCHCDKAANIYTQLSLGSWIQDSSCLYSDLPWYLLSLTLTQGYDSKWLIKINYRF